jgi:hypothetical protein
MQKENCEEEEITGGFGTGKKRNWQMGQSLKEGLNIRNRTN